MSLQNNHSVVRRVLYLKHRFAVVNDTPARLRMRHDSTHNLADADLQAPSVTSR